MEVKFAIFNAAREGKLRRLKVFLDRCSRKEVSQLVSAKTNGATPLIIAAKIGHLPCVEYLVDQCCADIEQVGSVEFDGETIDGAPPLWCAAAAGHIDVVAFLLSKGANVNATTKTNSTPLRAACFDGHLNIVKYLAEHNADIEVSNRHGHTCLMIACYKGHYEIAAYLIKMGAKVNRKSSKGNTALHDCAECGSLDIMKLLIKYQAQMDIDSYGMTPLLAAAVTGHTHIVKYLIARKDLITVRERVDALELLGATYVDKKRDMLGALKVWKKAMVIRQTDGTYPKDPAPPNPAYDCATEVTTLETLEEIISDPDQMRMQALIVRERILGPAHPDTSYYIRYRGAVYADTGNFNRCVILWMYALSMQQKILEPLSPMTQSSFVSFTELFWFMIHEGRNKTEREPVVNFCDMMNVFDKCLKEIEGGMGQIQRISSPTRSPPHVVVSYNSVSPPGSTVAHNVNSNSAAVCNAAGERDSAFFHRTLLITLNLICLLNKFVGNISKEQKREFRVAVYRFLRLNPRGSNGVTPLHLACSRESSSVIGRLPVSNFPNLEVIQLLLHVGANPNCRDNSKNTPLHTLATSKFCRKEIVEALLEGGAHLDTINEDGDTFESLRASRGQPLHQLVNPLRHTSLQCLAAKVIRKHRIPYKHELHRRLNEFVNEH